LSMVLMTSSKVLIALMVLLLLHDVTCARTPPFGAGGEHDTAITVRAPEPELKDLFKLLENLEKKLDQTLQNKGQQDVSILLNTYCTTRFNVLEQKVVNLSEKLNMLLQEMLNSSGEKIKTSEGPSLFSLVMNWHKWEFFNWHVWKSISDAEVFTPKTISDFWVVEILGVLISVGVLWEFGIIHFFFALLSWVFWKFFAWLGSCSPKAETKEAPKAEDTGTKTKQQVTANTAKATTDLFSCRSTHMRKAEADTAKCQTCGKLRADRILVKQCMEPHGARVGDTVLNYMWYLNGIDTTYGREWMENGYYSRAMRESTSGN
jgi:hypothetical protein